MISGDLLSGGKSVLIHHLHCLTLGCWCWCPC